MDGDIYTQGAHQVCHLEVRTNLLGGAETHTNLGVWCLLPIFLGKLLSLCVGLLKF